jgi:trk system potassium uptake protein
MKDFVVIGCGRFGQSVARSLYSKGHDVMAIDIDPEKVQEISDEVTHAIEADSTEEASLKTLGIRNFDVAVVSIGTDIQASILTTLIVKELGVKHVVAKAQNDIHAKVLYKIGADRVVLPERDMGIRLAHNLVTHNVLDYIELDPNYSVIEITALKEWEGKMLKNLQLPTEYGVNIMAIKCGDEINISPLAEDTIKKGDILILIGSTENINRLGEEE